MTYFLILRTNNCLGLFENTINRSKYLRPKKEKSLAIQKIPCGNSLISSNAAFDIGAEDIVAPINMPLVIAARDGTILELHLTK